MPNSGRAARRVAREDRTAQPPQVTHAATPTSDQHNKTALQSLQEVQRKLSLSPRQEPEYENARESADLLAEALEQTDSKDLSKMEQHLLKQVLNFEEQLDKDFEEAERQPADLAEPIPDVIPENDEGGYAEHKENEPIEHNNIPTIPTIPSQQENDEPNHDRDREPEIPRNAPAKDSILSMDELLQRESSPYQNYSVKYIHTNSQTLYIPISAYEQALKCKGKPSDASKNFSTAQSLAATKKVPVDPSTYSTIKDICMSVAHQGCRQVFDNCSNYLGYVEAILCNPMVKDIGLDYSGFMLVVKDYCNLIDFICNRQGANSELWECFNDQGTYSGETGLKARLEYLKTISTTTSMDSQGDVANHAFQEATWQQSEYFNPRTGLKENCKGETPLDYLRRLKLLQSHELNIMGPNRTRIKDNMITDKVTGSLRFGRDYNHGERPDKLQRELDEIKRELKKGGHHADRFLTVAGLTNALTEAQNSATMNGFCKPTPRSNSNSNGQPTPTPTRNSRTHQGRPIDANTAQSADPRSGKARNLCYTCGVPHANWNDCPYKQFGDSPFKGVSGENGYKVCMLCGGDHATHRCRSPPFKMFWHKTTAGNKLGGPQYDPNIKTVTFKREEENVNRGLAAKTPKVTKPADEEDDSQTTVMEELAAITEQVAQARRIVEDSDSESQE